MQTIKLLVIEDETAIRDMIRFSLPNGEFTMLEAENARQAMNLLKQNQPDIMVVDWMLPGKSGIEFIKWLKQESDFKSVPIIMLTARAEEENKIRGLEAGADDYVIKPFSPRELLARIKAVLRRGILVSPEGIIKVKNIFLNTESKEVLIDNIVLPLTPIEYRLLHFFVTHPNRVYTRDQIITLVWGSDIYIDERTVDVQIRRLRERLKPYGHHQLLKTVRGSGYQLTRDKNES